MTNLGKNMVEMKLEKNMYPKSWNAKQTMDKNGDSEKWI
jgi:hypothetical protein